MRYGAAMLVWLGLMVVWVWPRYWALAGAVLIFLLLQSLVHWGVADGLAALGLWPRDAAAASWGSWAARTAGSAGLMAALGVPLVALRKHVQKNAYRAPPKVKGPRDPGR